MNLTNDQKQLIAVITEAIVGLIALYNFIAPYFNLPNLVVGTEQITSIVTGIVMLCLLVWVAWKNHNVTPESQLSQQVLNSLKSGVLAPEAVVEMLDEAEEEFQDTIDDINADIENELVTGLDEEINQEVEEFMNTKGEQL